MLKKMIIGQEDGEIDLKNFLKQSWSKNILGTAMYLKNMLMMTISAKVTGLISRLKLFYIN